MKNPFRRAPVFNQLRCGCEQRYENFVARINKLAVVRGCVSRQHQLLLGIGIFLLLCWTIGSIWLINARQSGLSAAEILAEQETSALLFSEGLAPHR